MTAANFCEMQLEIASFQWFEDSQIEYHFEIISKESFFSFVLRQMGIKFSEISFSEALSDLIKDTGTRTDGWIVK